MISEPNIFRTKMISVEFWKIEFKIFLFSPSSYNTLVSASISSCLGFTMRWNLQKFLIFWCKITKRRRIVFRVRSPCYFLLSSSDNYIIRVSDCICCPHVSLASPAVSYLLHLPPLLSVSPTSYLYWKKKYTSTFLLCCGWTHGFVQSWKQQQRG